MNLNEPGSWAVFAGNLHPVLLHLPIGAVSIWVFVEVVSWFTKGLRGARRTLLWLTMLSALLAFGSGWLLGATGEYGGPIVTRHKTLAIVMTALLVLLSVLDLFWRRGWLAGLVRTLGMFAVVGCAVLTGHLGGVLTRGEGALQQGAPPKVVKWLTKLDERVLPTTATPADVQDIAIFDVLERNCIKCHGPNKQKGKLRLDRADQIRKQVVPGDVVGSEMLRRVLLPKRHEDRMPPEDELAETDLLTMIQWVRTGAPLGEIAQAQAAATTHQNDAQAALDRIATASGATIAPVEGTTDGLRVDFARADSPPASGALAELAPIAERVRQISIAGQPLARHSLDGLPEFPALRRLNLERSGATNQIVQLFLAKTPGVQVVNLHSTAVDKDILAALDQLTELRRVVLFGTSIDPADIADFATEHPEVEITAALELPPQRDLEQRMRRILAADPSKRRIALLRETAIGTYDELWHDEVEQLHDLAILPNGNILYQRSWTQLVEADPTDGREVWSYDAATANRDGAPGPLEVHSFGRLGNGHTFLAESGPARILEVDGAGVLQHVIPLRVDHPDPHRDTRLVRPTDAGTYLVAHEGDRVVREYSRDGEVVWTHDVGSKLFSAIRLPNGNTMIGTGDGHGVLEIDAAGDTVWSFTAEDVPGTQLAWITTVQLLPSGNLVVGNCHADPLEPQLFEVNRDKQIVWTFCDHERFGGALSNSHVVDPPR